MAHHSCIYVPAEEGPPVSAWAGTGSPASPGSDPADLRMRVEQHRGMCVLRIGGELDVATVGWLTDQATAMAKDLVGPVLIDLSDLEFVDCRGARALVTIAGVLQARLTGTRPGVRRVLAMLGLHLEALPAREYGSTR